MLLKRLVIFSIVIMFFVSAVQISALSTEIFNSKEDNKPRYIFKGCKICQDKPDTVKCDYCDHKNNIYDGPYNEEEIENRGKVAISRPNPYKKTYWIFISISSAVVLVWATIWIWLGKGFEVIYKFPNLLHFLLLFHLLLCIMVYIFICVYL